MPTIDIPEGEKCARCGQNSIVLLRRGSLYCGANCARHDEVIWQLQELARMAEQGRGGSPLARELLAPLLDNLECLVPVRPTQSCERCWGPMAGGQTNLSADGSLSLIERCPYCGWCRPMKARLGTD